MEQAPDVYRGESASRYDGDVYANRSNHGKEHTAMRRSAIPISARVTASKPFYVFFSLGGKYDGCYTVIHARSYDRAREQAVRQWGMWEVGKISNNAEWSEARAKQCRLKRI